MTSTNTYTAQTIPYFYIIQHKISKKLYAGSKWAKGCNPNTFMIKNGYTTSSPIINLIIKSEGLDSFYILRIDTNLDGLSAYDYETLFLQCNNCAESTDWYNKHNNTLLMVFGKNDYTEFMLAKYNVKHNSQIPKVKEQKKLTCFKNSGFDYPMQSLITQEKSKQTNLKNSGFEYNLQIPYVKEQIKITCLEKYGYSHPLQSPIIKEKSKQTNLKNSGFDYPMQSLITQEKSKQTCLEKYGVDNPSKNPIIRNKVKVTNDNKPILICPCCNSSGKGHNWTRWHFNKCKLK
jgi:hypothetical protein